MNSVLRTSLRSVTLLSVVLSPFASLDAQWDPNQTYRLSTRFQGVNKALDVIEGGADDKDLIVDTVDANDPGQYWRITRIRTISGVTYWRLSSILHGNNMAVDTYNGGPKNNRTHIVNAGPFTGQFWRIQDFPGFRGFYRLTNLFRGATLGLEGAGGPTTDRPCMKPVGPFTGQMWRIVPVDLPQPLLYYKFDRNTGDIAVNYGSDPVDSTLVNRGGSGPWKAPGKEGAAMLAGSEIGVTTDFRYCDTGKTTGWKGDMTISMWVDEATAKPGNRLSYLFGGMGNFRCFTGGIAGESLWVRNAVGGSTFNIIMPTVGSTFQTRAQSGIYVALVIKGLVAQWYINGATHGAAITLPAAIDIPGSTSSFKVGKHVVDASSSAYEIDEFRLYNRAASAAEIERWSSPDAPDAASGAYGRKCGITLGTAGGPPRIGNSRYAHTIQGPPNMRFLFAIGLTTQSGFDMGAVFPALRGCTWYSAFDIQFVAATGGSGRIAIPGGVPNNTSAAGASLDTQVLGFAGGGAFQSNAVSHKVELY